MAVRRRKRPDYTEEELAYARAFGRRLQALRKAKGYSQQRLADKAKVHHQTIVKLESTLYHHEPNLRVLRCIARALRCSVSHLIRVQEELKQEAEETKRGVE